MSRNSRGHVCSFSGRRLKVALALFLFGCAVLCAPVGRAEDLHYFKNYFVTGDYAVDGVGLYAKGVNGWATGTITPADVPAGADIVAAYLIWATVETTPNPSSMNGYFDFDSSNPPKPNPIVGEVVGSPSTPPCWSQGGTGGPGDWLRVYRADVLRFLKVDANGTVRDVDYTHTVTLPDSGINQPGMVPHTEGASLVVVWRLLDGKTPYKAVVIYDGAFTMAKGSAAFAETIGGFYQASGGVARMTQIVANGQPGFAAKLTVNGTTPAGVNGEPFVGAAGPRWDNPTFNINLAANASSLQTQVLGENNQVCLSWGAILVSTNVVHSDGDGILDTWKINGLHLNIGSPATSAKPSVPATFDGCAQHPKDPCENLAAMGAVSGPTQKPPIIHPDIFVQMDWMEGSDGHIHSPKLAALQAITGAFSAHKIYVHFDVGNRYQQFATAANNYMIVPKSYAQGGHVIQESSLECPNNVITNVEDCEYDTRDLGYSVLGWKTGIGAIENGFAMLNIPPSLAHDRKDFVHEFVLAHALAGPIDPHTGLPVSPPPSTSGVGDLFGRDVMVTLGLWRTDNPVPCTQDDPTGTTPDSGLCTDQTGTSLVQAGTLFHELGHNLGLHHAGAVDTPNCMVDYPSTMNYLYQTRGLTGPPGDHTGVANGIEHIDYSIGMLGPLNENLLLGTPDLGMLPYRLRYYGPATGAEIAAGSNAKANCNGTFPGTGTPSVRLETPLPLTAATIIDWSNGTGMGLVAVGPPAVYTEDIDYSGAIGDSVPGGVGFVDNNDWAALNLPQMGGAPNVSGLSVDVGPADINTNDLLGQSVLGQNVLGQNVLGQNVLGQSVLGQNVLGQSVLGQNVLGQNVLGQNVLGQNVLGQNVLGEVDYDTAISTLDATGASTPLVATPSATSGTAYNQVSLNWGLPSIGQIRTYTIYRLNLDAPAGAPTVAAGTVSGTPPATAFNDPVTDANVSDIGANCPSGNVCYDTHYQYYVIATDTRNNSSTPSNLVNVIVDHLFVTGFTGSVIYGNALPNSMEATIVGTFPAGVNSSAFTCPNPAPRNVGSYPDTCTGPAAVGTPATVGVTYIAGVLMITQRPLVFDATTDTKLYDSTVNPVPNTVVPSIELTVAGVGNVSGSGLVNSDTVSGLVEAYQSPNVLGLNGSTLAVIAGYSVNDGNGGQNYIVTTHTALGTITARPLYIDAVTNSKLYDATTTASALPTVEATGASTGLVGTDTVPVLVEAYQSPNVLGLNGSTLSVTAYTVNDGNGGHNYIVTTKTAAGTITARPLYIDAVANTKVYDSTTTAGAVPVPEPAVPNVSGLAGNTDNVTGAVEAYQSPNVLGVNGSTLSATVYTVNDGNGGHNYIVTTKTAAGTITARPLYIDAIANIKVYDSTPTAGAVPVPEPTVPNVSGLVGLDNVTGAVEMYLSQNVLGGGGSTLVVATYRVNDGNGGQNYSVTTKISAGTITARPLIIDAQPNTRVYDGTTSAAASPTVEARTAGTGFVGTDGFTTAPSEAYASPNVSNNDTLSVSAGYVISDGNNGNNYAVATNTAVGVITPAPLTVIVANNAGTFTASSYSGFVNGDSSSLFTSETLVCTTLTADGAGNTPISCSGLSTPNYAITYSYAYSPEMTLAGGSDPLTIEVNGANNNGSPTYTPTYSGLVNGDLPSVVTGTLSCTLTANGPNFTPSSCGGLSAPANYTIFYSSGTVTGP